MANPFEVKGLTMRQLVLFKAPPEILQPQQGQE